MANGGFIEPPPGLFDGDANSERSSMSAPGGRGFSIRTESDVPPMPRLAPAPEPVSAPDAAEHAPTNESIDETTSDSWIALPRIARRERPLPRFPRLAQSASAAPAAPESSTDPEPVAPASPAAHADSLPEWSLVLADGVVLPLYGPLIVGRNPSTDDVAGAHPAAIADPTRTMSKTHARFFLDDGVPMVDDLDSTNGIALFPGGNTHGAMAVEPGSPAELRSGDVVQLGEYEITMRRN